MKVFSHFPSTSHSPMYRCLISTFKFCPLFALLNYETSSYSFEVSGKFCTNSIFTLKSKDNLNLKSQSFSPYEYTQKDIFPSMSWFLTTWNHLICFNSHQNARQEKAFSGKVMNNVSKVIPTTALSNDELFSDPK